MSENDAGVESQGLPDGKPDLKSDGPAAVEPQAAGRKGKWRRRFVRILVVSVALVVLIRVALAALLPTVIHKTARQFGFDLDYRRLDLNLVGTQAGIWGVSLRPKDAPGEDLVRTDYAFANISSLALFRLKLVAYRVEADGVEVKLVRKADGSVPLLDMIKAATASDAPQSGEPLRFESPATVEAVRLHHVNVDVTDETVSPPFKDRFTMNLRVSDVGAPGRPATLDVEAHSRSMLQALRVRGEADLRGDSLAVAVTFGVHGLRVGDARAYLASLGVRGGDLPLDLTGVADLSLSAAPGKAGVLRGTASVRDVRLMAGGDEAVRLERGEATVAEWSPSALHVSRVAARGGLLRLRRTPEGLVTFASLSRAATEVDADVAPATAPAATASATQPTPFAWKLDELVATDLAGEFRDQLPAPERRFEARVASFEVRNLAGAGPKEAAATLKIAMSVPGVASDLSIAGEAFPFAEVPRAVVVFDAAGVKPDALGPYLAPLGIEPTLKAGRFHAAVEATAENLAGGSPRVGLKVADVRLDEGGAGLLNMASVRVLGLERDPESGAIEMAEVEATGPTLVVRRLDADTLELPAFRLRRVAAVAGATIAAAPASGPAASRPTPPATTPSPAALPVVRVNRLTWGGANVRLEDRSTQGAEPIDLSDARLEVSGFVLDLRPDAPPSPPGKITGRFRSAGLAEGVRLDGTLTPGAGSLAADLTLAGEGLNLQRLAPYLRPLGVEPRLKRGAAKVGVRASVAQQGKTMRLAAEVRDAELTDEGTRLFALGGAAVDRVEISPAGYGVGNVTITKPYARVERDADGGFIAGGVKLLPMPSTAPATTQPVHAPGEPGGPPAGLFPDPFEFLAALPPLRLESLKVDNAEVDWIDRAPGAAGALVEVKLVASATVEALAMNGQQPQAAKYDVLVSSPSLVERVRVAGTIEPGRDSLSLAGEVDAAGLRPAALAPYLPPGVEPAMDSGTFKAVATATLARGPDGALRGEIKVDSLVVRDDGGAAGAAPLAAVGGVNLVVDRFDRATGDVSLPRISITGVEGSAARDADGSVRLLGLRLAPPPPPADATAGAPTETAATAETAPADLRAIVAEAQSAMPLVAVESLDVRVKRLSFEDRMRKAEPVALADLRLWNDAPVRLMGPKPESNPPVKLNIAGAIDPVVKQFAVTAQAAPFAERPNARVKVEAAGMDGDALTRVAPELAETLDGRTLADGRFRTALEVEANVRRRGPTRIDLSRGLELNFALTQTALRAGENGPILAGVGLVRGEGLKVETRSGDVTVRSLEVNDLAGSAWREASGVHVLGMRVKGTEVTPGARQEAPPPEPAAQVAAAAQPAAEAGPVAEVKPEVRIDRLTVSGLDFRFEDRALDPPVVVPVTSLDAEVRGLSSLVLERERPVRFNLSVGAGKVSLPKKLRGGVLTGALGDLAKLAGARPVDAAPELEERDFFAQIVAAGNVKLYPKPAGRAQASVNGVELGAIRGLAAAGGVGLSGGVFDGRVEMKTRDDQKLDVRSRFVLTDLSLSEPPGGPIVRYLGLPAPLDVVIGAVEAPDRSITLPIHFQVDGATPKGIGGAAVGALAQVLVTAVAATPVKAVTGVAGLFGDTVKDMEVVEEPPVYLAFAAGVTSLEPAEGARLAAVLRRAKRDKGVRVAIEHELGGADVALAERRANPSAAQAKALAENLLVRRRELLGRRDALAGAARAAALTATGDAAGGDARAGSGGARLAEYRTVASELAAAEEALDRLYDFQRPGAERLADRRTRAAAIELADARLARVRAAAAAALGEAAVERVRVGASRFTTHGDGASRLVITVARSVPKAKRPRGG